MAIQKATTGNLSDAQRIAIAKAIYTEEHSKPCANLITHLTLAQGEKSITVPKVGQMTAQDLVDGQDLVDSEDIGMTSTDLTTAEVGLRVIITDKLERQENESVMGMVGVQMGDAMARQKEEKIIALFPGLNGGTILGLDDKNMSAQNFSACIAYAKANKYPNPLFAIHHPNAVFALMSSLAPVGATASVAIPKGFSEDLLSDFFAIKLGGVPVFETGNIAVVSGTASAYGVIASKGAMCIVESMGQKTETDRDISLRATELVVVADYGCFELDDAKGAAMQYEIGNPSSAN